MGVRTKIRVRVRVRVSVSVRVEVTSKMMVGMDRSVMVPPAGNRAMTMLQLRPGSLTISGPIVGVGGSG